MIKRPSLTLRVLAGARIKSQRLHIFNLNRFPVRKNGLTATYLMSIFPVASCFAIFGKATCKTPSLNSALIFSASTLLI